LFYAPSRHLTGRLVRNRTILLDCLLFGIKPTSPLSRLK
jgi:hypothetical protein